MLSGEGISQLNKKSDLNFTQNDSISLKDSFQHYKTNSFNLLFTGFIIDYNLYHLSDLKDFCMNYCLSTNSLKNNKSSTNLKINTTTFKDQKRNFSTTIIKNNNESSQDKDLNYNKSIFSILEKIKELTKNKDYNPRKVQLAIENI